MSSAIDFDNNIFDTSLTSNTIATSPTAARAWTAGLNWYLNRNTKFVFNWERTDFDGGAGSATNRPTENLFLSRLQVSF